MLFPWQNAVSLQKKPLQAGECQVLMEVLLLPKEGSAIH